MYKCDKHNYKHNNDCIKYDTTYCLIMYHAIYTKVSLRCIAYTYGQGTEIKSKKCRPDYYY